LKTPARSVFAILEAARQLKTKERAEVMLELTRVSAVSGVTSLDYYEELKKKYHTISTHAVPEHVKPEPPNGAKRVDWKTATRIMDSAMRLKMRLEHGRQ
jgi:hypothetical protein